MPEATSLAAGIASQCGVQPALVAGSNGVFDVFCDGALIFSKDRAGRFPEVGEIVAALGNS